MKLLLTIFFGSFWLFPANGVQAQTCNECDEWKFGCIGEDKHYDTCDEGTEEDGWEGHCEEGCKTWADCDIHTKACEVGKLASLNLLEARNLVEGADWAAIGEAALRGFATVDSERGLLFLYGCSRKYVVGKLPVGVEAVSAIQETVKARRMALLAELIPKQ